MYDLYEVIFSDKTRMVVIAERGIGWTLAKIKKHYGDTSKVRLLAKGYNSISFKNKTCSSNINVF